MHAHPWMRAARFAAVLLLAACVDQEPMAPAFDEEPASALNAADNTYSGRATVVKASVPLLGIQKTVSDAGPLPPSGGADRASLLTVSIPKLLTAKVAHAATVAQGNASRSQASLADVVLTVGGHTIRANLLMALAVAECVGGVTPWVNGRSHIAQLTIDGKAITVTGKPNQTISLGVGKIVINEQRRSVSGSSGAITVNALHVIIPGVANVVIAHAHADIDCLGVCPPPHGDFVTGGGSIQATGRANFGVAGGLKGQGLWGHLEFHDKGNNLKVHGTSITAYVIVSAKTRRIKGTARINGSSGTFVVEVTDNGEPGSYDTFKIRLSTGYSASGTLNGGNIQLHDKATACD